MLKTDKEPTTNCQTCRLFWRIKRALLLLPKQTTAHNLHRAFVWARWHDWVSSNRVYSCKLCSFTLERISGRQ